MKSPAAAALADSALGAEALALRSTDKKGGDDDRISLPPLPAADIPVD